MWFRLQQRLILFFIFLISSHSPTLAFEMGVDGFVAMNHEEVSTYRHSYVFLGGDTIRIGMVQIHEAPHEYQTDHIEAVGLRFGGERYLEIAVGKYSRTFNGKIGKGRATIIQYGGRINDWVTLSLPIVIKSITEGDLRNRRLIEAVPHLGIRIGL